MKVAQDAPKRPALRYYGGKWSLAPWIISHFPPHKNYVEPCGGAASVLLQKQRSPLETYNDLDGNVVNFFRVLRDNPDELIRKIRLTPWARSEFETAVKMEAPDPIERARLFFIRSWMSMHGGNEPLASDWRRRNDRQSPAVELRNIQHLNTVAERLSLVQIESDTAQRIIDAYNNRDSLIYFDPPYVQETRVRHNGYAIEPDDIWQVEVAELLRNAAGCVVVSGYACPLYTDIYEAHGWQRVDKEAQTNSGGKRIESLWLSPRTHAALFDKYADMPLFASSR